MTLSENQMSITSLDVSNPYYHKMDVWHTSTLCAIASSKDIISCLPYYLILPWMLDAFNVKFIILLKMTWPMSKRKGESSISEHLDAEGTHLRIQLYAGLCIYIM